MEDQTQADILKIRLEEIKKDLLILVKDIDNILGDEE